MKNYPVGKELSLRHNLKFYMSDMLHYSYANLTDFLEKVDFEKNQQTTKEYKKLPSR